MVRHCQVVRVTANGRLQSNVAAYLPRYYVTVTPQQSDKFVTGKITR
jgi:hypothetical protein